MVGDLKTKKKTKPNKTTADVSSYKTRSKKITRTKKTKTGKRPFDEVDQHVHEVLIELMSASASDSVRVAAAKALMDKIKKHNEDGDGEREDEAEHAAAILEAQKLLEEITCSKSVRADRKGKVDKVSKAKSINAKR